VHMKRPSEIANEVNVYMFREGCFPSWEVRSHCHGIPLSHPPACVTQSVGAAHCVASISLPQPRALRSKVVIRM
jgi:hypothetical protein